MSGAVVTLNSVVAAVLVAVSPVCGQSVPSCYQGFIGSAASLRRVVVERSGRAAIVHLYSRPARTVELRSYRRKKARTCSGSASFAGSPVAAAAKGKRPARVALKARRSSS